MTNGLDVVTIGVSNEGAEVIRMVLGPEPWFVQHLGALADRSVKELLYGGASACRESDVRFSKSLATVEWSDPERGHRRHAETNDGAKIHDASAPESGEHGVIEPSARRNVSALN
jgi:hypothetical protein